MMPDSDNPRESEMATTANGPHDASKRRTLRHLAAWGFLALTGQTVLEGCGRAAGRGLADGAGTETEPENLVICILDAARADHFGCYGYPRGTTPNIDELARESLIFRNHFCQDSATKASTASLFTGQHPDTHLAFGYRSIPDSTFTLARAMQQTGLRTVMISANPWTCPETESSFGFGEVHGLRSMETMETDPETPTPPGPQARLFADWVEKHRDTRFFAYLHFLPPHLPYAAPDHITEMFQGMPPGYTPERYHPGEFEVPLDRPIHREVPALPGWINLYDANLCHGDWAIGEVVRILREKNLLDKTVLVITADHGEAFGEHGFVLHSPAVHDEVAHIPLLIRFPGASPAQEITALTQTIDILPTMCDLFGVERPDAGVQGASLVPVITGESKSVNDHVFMHSDLDRHKYLVRNHEFALVLYGAGMGDRAWRRLYHLPTDPAQTTNVLDQYPSAEGQFLEAFREYAGGQRWDLRYCIDPSAPYADRPRGSRKRLSPETERQLRALGYL